MNKISTFLYLLIPSLLNALCWNEAINNYSLLYFILVYIITIIGIFVFFKFKPCRFYVLLLGLILSPLPSFAFSSWELLEYRVRGDGYYAGVWQFGYLFTIVSILFYVLPFTVISVIVKRLRWW